MIKTLSPEPWADYELVDSGHFEKLERFGKFTLRRPEPQAIWSPSMPEEEWKKRALASFERGKANAETGNWALKPGMPEKWFGEYKRNGLNIKYKLSLSSFKHVGIFPEQAVNWDYLYANLSRLKSESGKPPLALNLFAYTGIASVVCKAAGADITHLDSIKQVVTWARENMEASNLDGIRWMVDDALKFAQREERRGKKYQCLILDPPAYGRGPEGEKWLLEEHLPKLLQACQSILDPENHVLVLNLYSLGFSTLITENLIKEYFPKSNPELGEIFLEDGFGKKLPLGTFARFSKFQ
jgi:23S rRNA (cytosine1962-C5)-methyltransferase